MVVALRRCDMDLAEAGFDSNSDIRSIVRCALARSTGDWSEKNNWLDSHNEWIAFGRT